MKHIKFIVLVGLILLNFILLPDCTHASTPNYLYKATIDPSTQRYVAKRNFKIIESKVTVTNTGEDALFRVATSEDSRKLDTKVIYLNKEQKWAHATAPILLKSKESAIFSTIITRKEGVIEERDYYVNTNFSIHSIHTPPSSEDVIRIIPEVITTTIIAVNDIGMTDIKTSVAYFTNTSGPIVTNADESDLILLIQNLGRHSISLEGEMVVKDPERLETTVNLLPAIIKANGQSYISNQKGNHNIAIKDPLKFGRYELSAKFKVFPNKSPTIFTNYSFWSIPKGYIYSFILILLILFMVSSLYFIRGSKNE